MNRWALVITYSGEEPTQESIRRAIEGLATYISMNPQTINPVVLNEAEIAAAIVNKATTEGTTVVVPEVFPEEHAVVYIGTEFDKLLTDIHAFRTNLEYAYVLAKVQRNREELVTAVRIIGTTQSKLLTVKMAKERFRLSLREAKDVIDTIQDVYRVCQEHIAG